MKSLRHQNGPTNSEDLFGSIAAVVGGESGEIPGHGVWGNSVEDGISAHRLGLVMRADRIVATHQQLLDFSDSVQLDRHVETFREHRRGSPVVSQPRSKNERYWCAGHLGRAKYPLGVPGANVAGGAANDRAKSRQPPDQSPCEALREMPRHTGLR